MAAISMSSSATAWKGVITWSYTQNIGSNVSTVRAVVSTWKTDSYPSSSASGAYFNGVLYIGSESKQFSFQQQNVASESSPQWQAELEVPITHNADGTASVYIYCQIDAPAGVSMYNKPLKGGGTYSLTTIPRDSQISESGKMYFGNPCRIVWTPASSSFYYKLKFNIGSKSYTTGVISPRTTNAYEYTGYTIPLSEAEQFPNSEFGTMSVSLYTYSDSACRTQVGSASTSSFSVYVPDSVIPTISQYNIAFDNSANEIVDSWGIGIVGYSGVTITASANGVYGSEISSFEISGSYDANPIAKYHNDNDKTKAYLEYTGGKFTSSGNKSFTISCIDSRGRKSNPIEINSIGSNPISVLPYTKPKILSISTTKDDRGTAGAEDDVMVVTASWEYDLVSNYNYASGVVYYKISNATTWTRHPGAISNGVPFRLENLYLQDDKSYNIQVVVTDAVGGSDSKSSFSSTAQVLLDFRAGGKGLGIGKICEDDGMEVMMNATFYNDVNLLRDSNTYEIGDYISSVATSIVEEQLSNIKTVIVNAAYPVGSIYVSMSDIEPSTLFGVGEWERITNAFLFGAGTDPDISYLPGDTGGEFLVKLDEKNLPAHSHDMLYSVNGGAYNTGSMGRTGNFSDTNYLGFSDSVEEFVNYSVVIGETGEGVAHNNMPPFLAVNMWRRTG